MWVWTQLAQLTASEPELPHWEPGELAFSTFEPGEEPDVWPVLEQQTAAQGWAAGLLAALGVWLTWLAFRQGRT